jgi:hypothetical protein
MRAIIDRLVSRLVIAAAVGLPLATPAVAAQARGPFPLTIDNETGRALACYALAGHWYGFDLGTVAAGRPMRLPLSVQTADRTLSLPNSLGQPVPIQMIYCGTPGNAWDSRTVLDLQTLVMRDRHRALCTGAGAVRICR